MTAKPDDAAWDALVDELVSKFKDPSGDAGDDDWPEPQPLIPPLADPAPYPLDALSPTLRGAVSEYGQYGQQPVPIAAASALSAASLAVQGLVDVMRDTGLCGPIVLYLLLIALSGERKTSVDKWFRKAIWEWLFDERKRLAPKVAEAKVASDAWTAERDGIVNKIRRASGAGDDGKRKGPSIEALKAMLADLDETRPIPVLVPSLFVEDITPEAIALTLANGWPSAALWSDEAALFVGSHAMGDQSVIRTMGLLNRLWDGLPFDRRRATSDDITVRGRRLTVNLMMQPVAFSALVGIGDGLARGLGFLARFLLSWPTSTMGTRLYRPPPDVTPALDEFNRRIRELLNMPLPLEPDAPDNALLLPVMQLSAPARAKWISFFDETERTLAPGGDARLVADVAAKTAEQAVRLAAVMSVFEEGVGDSISLEFMEAGCAIAAWHLGEAQRILASAAADPVTADAINLLHWLRRRRDPATRSDILQFGPVRLRDKQRRDAALQRLLETGHVREVSVGRQSILLCNPKSEE
jgi:Protein of unknown function (DUF3987)